MKSISVLSAGVLLYLVAFAGSAVADIRNFPPPALPIELNKDLKITASPALQKELDTANGGPVCLSRAQAITTPPTADADKDYTLIAVYPCSNEKGGRLRTGMAVLFHSTTWLDVVKDPTSGVFVNVLKLAASGQDPDRHLGVGPVDASGAWALDTLCNGTEGNVCNLDFFDQRISLSNLK